MYRPASYRATRILLMLLAGGVIVLLVGPLIVVVGMSFTPKQVLVFPPGGFSIRWYEHLFRDPLWRQGFVASAEVATVTAVLSTILGTMAALGISRGRFPGKSIYNALILVPAIVPTIVLAIGMFMVFVPLGLGGTVPGLVLAHTPLAIPFVAITVTASLRGVDRNLEWAALSLGAGPLRTFFRVTLPLILPGVVIGALFAFLTSWDEVIIASYLTNARFITVPVLIWNEAQQSVDPTVAAVSTVLIAVTVLGFVSWIVLNRRQVRG